MAFEPGSSINGSLIDPLLNDDCVRKECDKVTPYANASVLSTLTFSWISSLISLGNRKTLDLDDIPQLNSINSVFQSFPDLQKQLDICRVGASKITAYILAKSLFLTAWKEICWTSILATIYALARYVGPFLLDYFVQYLEQGNFRSRRGYFLAFAFCASSFIQCQVRRNWIFKLQQVGIRLRATTSTMIYNKGLKLALQSKQGEGSGEFVNLLAVDVDRIDSFVVYIHDSWLTIFQVVLGMGLLYKNLGPASFAGLGALVCLMLSNSTFATWDQRFLGNLMEAKDKRIKVTLETLRNMRILKFQGWDLSFLSRILNLRKTEALWLKKYLINSSLMKFVYGITPTFVALVTFGSCLFLGVSLESGKILSALATFRVLQEPIYLLPDAISSLVKIKVSLGRIAFFLSIDEPDSNIIQNVPYNMSSNAIEITDGNFSWGPALSSAATLRNINLKIPRGSKIAIVGTVGSGKSSLLSSILGEMGKISGNVMVSGSKAYVAQTPWIQSGTVRENILFGKAMVPEIYDKVIEACCLKEDLSLLSFGDQTVIGERGINLSGGQKQRIQIARAVYHDADIYLLDDPFSALDAHTASHLFHDILLGLLKEKTVIFVTHQTEFSSAADLVMVMKDGSIAQMDKYNVIEEFVVTLMNKAQLTTCSVVSVENDDAKKINLILQDGNKQEEEPSQLIKEEQREKDSVGFRIYWKYLTTAYGGALVPMVFFGHIVREMLNVGSYYWLAGGTPTSKDNVPWFIGVYAILAITISLCTLVVDLLVMTIAYTTATQLFKKMLESIFRAPMLFFDATPSGRILSRCSTDQSLVETEVPSIIEEVFTSIIETLGIVVVMSMVAWPVLIIFIPVVFVCISYQRYYMPTSRELSRLSGICKAPVTQYFVETISGSTTIKSFDKQSRFLEAYMKILDTYSRPGFHSAAAMKWLLFRQDVFGSLTFAFLLLLLVSFGNNINPAIAGLAVSYGLTLNSALGGLVWTLSGCTTTMISVERILQYTSLPSEAPLVIEANKPRSYWPSHGEICITDLQVRYAPQLPLVLHGLTCTFKGGMKTGIVGRTGSGKSTLMQALLRLVEPTSGRILIDNIDISTIGLHDFRLRLGIIPQEPVMFQGTIRSNLDPLQMYTDENVWEALDKCQLGDEVRKMEKKLDSHVTENGENWSMGQRQLICLGRVLLKKCRVLLLDEATASVDFTTDNFIQQSLKDNFADSTIITIAHRITSVDNSDMVLVLNNGRIEEYGHPKKLLENKSSAFAKLVAASSNSRH
ncbi:ABC transporter C family member 3-like [Silene latifolia]|uniref:ABC transporter C family member 3-like n=1 Tax=Silene latifolia TaxID=37657 RepID=UPI003D782993